MAERAALPPVDVEFLEFLTRNKLLSYQDSLEEEG
jgi:hypothetical protein